jgi:hypothetical protein
LTDLTRRASAGSRGGFASAAKNVEMLSAMRDTAVPERGVLNALVLDFPDRISSSFHGRDSESRAAVSRS